MKMQDAKTLDNFERLRKHLKDGSLAVQLIQAHHNARPADRPQSVRAVLQGRLDQVRTSLDNAKT